MSRYWLPAGSSDNLTMHILWNDNLTPALWQQSGVFSSSWEVAEVTVSAPTKYKVSGVNNTQIQLHSLTISHEASRILLVYSCESETQLMSFTRWCCRPSTDQTPGLRWKSMTFLGGLEPAVLQGAVTLNLDTATFSLSTGKMDTTGCCPTEASRVQKQTTLLKPQMVDALFTSVPKHEHTKGKSHIYFKVEISVFFIAKVNC